MMMMCWNCEMMEEISIQFVRLDYFSNMCECTRLTRLQLYKTKYVLRIAVTRSNPVPDIILSVLEGRMVEMLVKASPQYKKFVHVTKSGKKLLYVRLKRALYGCIRSAMLWWTMLSEFLIKEGFKLNPYDSCVANKMLPCGKQITICWYVDDLKISSVNKKAVMEIIKKLEDRFGVMRKTFGKKHSYLGMDVEF